LLLLLLLSGVAAVVLIAAVAAVLTISSFGQLLASKSSYKIEIGDYLLIVQVKVSVLKAAIGAELG